MTLLPVLKRFIKIYEIVQKGSFKSRTKNLLIERKKGCSTVF